MMAKVHLPFIHLYTKNQENEEKVNNFSSEIIIRERPA